MSTTPDAMSEMEQRLRAALTARADLVRPEDLAPLAPVVELRPRWQSPWVLLATAAIVLLVLGAVLQGVGGPPRSDRIAPKPDEPRVVLPEDIGRDWVPEERPSVARLDLDGDGTRERVDFLAEPTTDFDGRIRLQTRLSSTGEETYGIVDLGTTIGTSPLDPIDADGDGDQELVLLHELDASVVGGLYAPVVLDLREGLLVEAVVESPDLLLQGNVAVPGSRTDHYEMVRSSSYWFEDGTLLSSRSVDTFASGNMTLLRPEAYEVEVRRWSLDADGVLRPDDPSCLVLLPEGRAECGSGADEGFVPYIDSRSTDVIADGETVDFDDAYPFSATVRAGEPPLLVVDGSDGRRLTYPLEVPDPQVHAQQPTGILSDGASFIVTSASDPRVISAVVQSGESLTALEATGEVPLENEGDVRSWVTANGGLVTATARDDGSWTAWTWQMVSRTRMAAQPWGTVCFDDIDDPTTARRC